MCVYVCWRWGWPYISENACLLWRLVNHCCRRLLRNICIYSKTHSGHCNFFQLLQFLRKTSLSAVIIPWSPWLVLALVSTALKYFCLSNQPYYSQRMSQPEICFPGTFDILDTSTLMKFELVSHGRKRTFEALCHTYLLIIK